MEILIRPAELCSKREVWVRDRSGEVDVVYGSERIAVHARAQRQHATVTRAEHHQGIPLGAARPAKIVLYIRETAPVVEIRPLAAYESVAAGGGR